MEKTIYWCDEMKDGTIVHRMKIGKQLKRAEDTAHRMLQNDLIDGVCIMAFNGATGELVKSIHRGKGYSNLKATSPEVA